MAGMIGYSIVSYHKQKKRLRVAVAVEENVYIADDIDSPFVMGVFKPRIYLPDGLSETERQFILVHERHHIRRMDHMWKLFAFAALVVHWFNPLVWLAFALASRDMEMSCDEAVVRQLGAEVRGDYAATLLSLATGKRFFAGTPLAFDEGNPKGRIKNLAKWKKHALWVTIVLAVVCGVLAVCLLTDPLKSEPVQPSPGQNWYFGTVKEIGKGVPEGEEQKNRPYFVITMPKCDDTLIWLSEMYFLPEDLAVGDYVAARVSVEESSGLTVTNRVEKRNHLRYDSLDAAITGSVLEQSSGVGEESFFPCVSFVTLSNEAGGPAKEMSHGQEPTWYTFYGIALYQLYSMNDGVLTEESGSHIPTVLSFVSCDDGKFELTSYWQPRDGSYYAQDIRGKFPWGAYPDTQKYIQQQMQECQAQARAHFTLNQSQPAQPEQTEQPTQPKETVAIPESIPNGIPGYVVYEMDLAQLPADYTSRQAAEDGCVVLVDGDVWANENLWYAFAVVISRWENAKIRMAEYTAEGNLIRIYELYGHDGNGFIYRLLKDGVVTERAYRWLGMDYGHGDDQSPAGKNYNMYKVYALTDEPAWELSGGVPAGSKPFDTWHNNSVMVYCDLRMVYEHPPMPEKLTQAAIVENGETVFQTWDREKLDRLFRLVSNAQGYHDEPKTQMMGPYLVLMGSDGGTVTAQIILNASMLKIDGVFYNYDSDWMEKYEVIDLLTIFAPAEELPENWLNP